MPRAVATVNPTRPRRSRRDSAIPEPEAWARALLSRPDGSVVGVCDTMVSPLVRYTDETFLVTTETQSYGESYAAPMALLDALLVACANARIERTLKLLEDAAREQSSGYRWYPEQDEPR